MRENGLLVRHVRGFRDRGIGVLTLMRWPLFHTHLGKSGAVLKLDGLGPEERPFLGFYCLIIQERVFLRLCGTIL